MSTNLITPSETESEIQTDIQSDTEPRPVRRHRVALIALGAVVVAAAAGGIAVARGGDSDPAPVPAPAEATAGLSCVQLAQMGPGANGTLSDVALAAWRQLWTAAHC
jgi:hypothetical protein